MSDVENNGAPARRRLRRWLIAGILGVFAIGALGFGGYWFFVGRYYVATDDAYVGGNRLMLTPQIAGTVVSIAADDNDRVRAGQPVIVLDRSNQQVALDRAEAELGAAVRRVRELQQQADAERAAVAIREAALAQARRDYRRDRHLIAVHGVTLEQFQHAQTAYDAARQQMAQARHRLAALLAQTSAPRLRDTPQVRLAIANLHQAWLDLQRAAVPAPASGYVAQRSVQLGQRVKPGQTLLEIVPLSGVWVDANFKETQLARVRIGQPVRLTADLYGGAVTYHGRVQGIAAGTGAAFELLPPQNATGNWIKIVRRVPVRVALDPRELKAHPLRIGLSMEATIDTHDLSGPVLAAAPPAKPVYATEVYAAQRSGFSALVERIIAENRAAPVPRATSGAAR